MEITAVIVDDEPFAIEQVTDLLQNYKEIKVVGSAGNGIDALEMVDKLQPDVLFLDIEMPKLNGIEVAKSLTHRNLNIIFTTAYSKYAVDAFTYDAIDFILKPIDRSRFHQSIERLIKKHKDKKKIEDFKSELDSVSFRPKQLSKFGVRVGRKIRVFEYDEISAFVAQEGLVQVYCGDKAIECEASLKEIEERLDPAIFFRTHRKYIINLNYFDSMFTDEDRHVYVTLSTSKSLNIKVSKEKVKELKSKLDLLIG